MMMRYVMVLGNKTIPVIYHNGYICVCVCVHACVQSGSVEPCSPRSPPRLVVTECDNHIKAVIIADTVTVDMAADDFDACRLILNLLSCYFAWDLDYPRQYQILTFFHENLLKETKEKHFKCVQYLKFVKLYTSLKL